MPRQTSFERDYRDLHGDEIEVDVEVRRYGPMSQRRFTAGRATVIKGPGPWTAVLGLFQLTGATMALVPLLIVAFLLIVVGLAALGVVIITLQAMWHIVFG